MLNSDRNASQELVWIVDLYTWRLHVCDILSMNRVKALYFSCVVSSAKCLGLYLGIFSRRCLARAFVVKWNHDISFSEHPSCVTFASIQLCHSALWLSFKPHSVINSEKTNLRKPHRTGLQKDISLLLICWLSNWTLTLSLTYRYEAMKENIYMIL